MLKMTWQIAFFLVIQQLSFFWLAKNAPEPGGVYNGSGSSSHVRYALPDGTTRSFLPRWQLRVSEATVQPMDRRAVVSMNRIERSLDELQRLRPQQHRQLMLVVGNSNGNNENDVSSPSHRLTSRTDDSSKVVVEEDTDRLAVVVAVKSGVDTERLLRITISELVDQMIQIGLYGEFFIINNNGRRQPADDTDRLRTMLETQVPGLDRVVLGRTERVPDRSPSVADEVVLPSDAISPAPRGRIQAIIVEQYHDHIKNSGKIRALRDMYHYLYREATAGRYRPELLLNIDAETRLRRRMFEVREGPIETLRKLTNWDH
jgi:hypothetical protein